jgi:hypothetical protein
VTALRATFHFGVRSLLIDEALLGQAVTVERDTMRVMLELPLRDQGSEELGVDPRDESVPEGLFADDDRARMIDRGGQVRGRTTVRPPKGRARVQILRARVFYDGSVSADDFADPDSHPDLDAAMLELRQAGEAARAAVHSFIENVRAQARQYWLGIRGTESVQVGDTELLDIRAERRLPLGIHVTAHVIRTGVGHLALSATGLQEVESAVAAGTSPDLARELLLDAAYFLDDDRPTDRQRAVLSAAIACEVRVKDVLRAAASNDREARLVDLLLASPRQYTLALVDLFDRPMGILTGHSVREEDDGELFRRVRKLIETRNAIAHRGEIPSEDTATECVRAAFDAFKWLDGHTLGASAEPAA